MKITIYEATTIVANHQEVHRATSKNAIYTKLASNCIREWPRHAWEDDTPEIPKGGHESIVDTFYYGGDDTSKPCILWDSFPVDLAMPDETAGQVSLCRGRLRVQRTEGTLSKGRITGPSARTAGSLRDLVSEDESDALESFILALAAAGFPIYHPEFDEALSTTIEAINNNA